MKNYYKILNVEYTANAFQIKKAYRIFAKMYHPDAIGNAPNKEKFQEIQEAYYTLINTEKRLVYDMMLRNYYQDLLELESKPHLQKEYKQAKYRYHQKNTNTQFIDKYTNQIIIGIFIFVFLLIVIIRVISIQTKPALQPISEYSIVKYDENGNEVEIKLDARNQFILDSILNTIRFKRTQQLTEKEIQLLENIDNKK